MSTVAVVGNTYPVKDQIKALGGRWDGAAKCWMVPAELAAQANFIVSGGAAPPRARKSTYGGTGYAPVRGCGACSRLGRMCKQCEFDEL